MRHTARRSLVLIAATAAATASLMLSPMAYAAPDAAAAKDLMDDNDCFKCHAVDKTKKGPSLKKIAAKYKGKEAEGEKSMLKNMTTGPKVKLEDGTEQEHKIIDTKDQKKLMNLVSWILAQ